MFLGVALFLHKESFNNKIGAQEKNWELGATN
jgi:hypothetical protein